MSQRVTAIEGGWGRVVGECEAKRWRAGGAAQEASFLSAETRGGKGGKDLGRACPGGTTI